MQTNKLEEYNRDDYLIITNEHCTSARLDRKIIVHSHCMTLDSIIYSQRMLLQEVKEHAQTDGTGVAFRADIDDCFNIGGKARIYIEANKYTNHDAVTTWMLYLRGLVVYDFDLLKWVMVEAQKHAFMFEVTNIAALIQREGGVARH